MKHTKCEELRKKMAEMYKMGSTRKQIMEALDLTPHRYKYHFGQLKHHGVITKKDANSVYLKEGFYGIKATRNFLRVRVGNMHEVMNALSPEIALWLREQVQEYDSFSEFLADILIDEYYRQQEVSKAKQSGRQQARGWGDNLNGECRIRVDVDGAVLKLDDGTWEEI